MNQEDSKIEENGHLKNSELIYLFSLSVSQPARIQEIVKKSNAYFDKHPSIIYFNENYEAIHRSMRVRTLVIPVRRGVYFLSNLGRLLIRDLGLHKASANERFFLMKNERKRARRR